MSDVEEIITVLAKYCQFVDDKRFEDFGALFTEDALFQRKDGSFMQGRETIWKSVAATFPTEGWAKHLTINPIITVNEDRADVSADFVVLECVPPSPPDITAVGRQLCTMRREHDGWRISERRR